MYAICYNCGNYFRIRNRKKKRRRCPRCWKYSKKNYDNLIYLTNKEFFNWIREKITNEQNLQKKLSWMYIFLNEEKFKGSLPKKYKIETPKYFRKKGFPPAMAYVFLDKQIIRFAQNAHIIWAQSKENDWNESIDTMIHEMIHIKRWKYRHLNKWICCEKDIHCKHFELELKKYKIEMDPKLSDDIKSIETLRGIPSKPIKPDGSPGCWGTYDGRIHCTRNCSKVHGEEVWKTCKQKFKYQQYIELHSLLPDEESQ